MMENNDDPLHWMGRSYQVEKKHPYPDLLPHGIKLLIIGSFPSKAPKNFSFFYGSKLNQFWPIIAAVYRHDFSFKKNDHAAKERSDFLRSKGIGLTDMLTSCYRYQDRSGDESLFPITFKNILELLDEHPTIRRLVFTGRQYIIGPLGLFITLLHQHDLEVEELKKDELKNLVGSFWYHDRSVEIMVPYSPSARFAAKQDYDFQHMVKMYRKCLSIS